MTYGFAWGFSDIQQEFYPLTDMATMMAAIAPLSPQYWRMEARWGLIATQQAPGAASFDTVNNVPTTLNRNWTYIDRCINNMLLTVPTAQIVMIIGTQWPSWGDGFFQGPSATDFGNFCKEVALRYQPGGVGIRTDGIYAPNAGKGVTNFEIWNEQNSSYTWNQYPISPTVYTAFLKAAYTSIKSVLPSTASTVIFGGMAHIQYTGPWFGYGNETQDELTFLTACYAAGCHGYFDALATHLYTDGDTTPVGGGAVAGTTLGPEPTLTTDNFRQIQAIHALMVTNGDGSVPMWITEVGFATTSLTQAQQSAYMQEAFNNLNTLSYVAVVLIYQIRDLGTSAATLNQNWGVMTYGFVKKQIWSFLQTLSGGAGPPAVSAVTGTFTTTGDGTVRVMATDNADGTITVLQ